MAKETTKRGREKGSTDLVVISPRLREAINDVLGSGGRRWKKKIPVSVSWLNDLGYNLVEVAEGADSSLKRIASKESNRRGEGGRLLNLKVSPNFRNQSKGDGKKLFGKENDFGRSNGSTFTIVAKSSIQRIFSDQRLYEKAYKFFRNGVEELPNWEQIPLGSIRELLGRMLSCEDELRESMVSEECCYFEIQTKIIAFTEQCSLIMKPLKINAALSEQEPLWRVPKSLIRAFVDATEDMAGDMPLYDVRRFLGKRKRLKEVLVSNHWKKLLR